MNSVVLYLKIINTKIVDGNTKGLSSKRVEPYGARLLNKGFSSHPRDAADEADGQAPLQALKVGSLPNRVVPRILVRPLARIAGGGFLVYRNNGLNLKE
jgi:hypothetical protein